MWRWSNGEGKVITTRLLKRDLPVLFQLGQDCLNEFPTSLNFYRYGDHFSFTERSAALRALDTALFFSNTRQRSRQGGSYLRQQYRELMAE
jgi:hypothetical protein